MGVAYHRGAQSQPLKFQPMASSYTEDHLVERPTIRFMQLELGWEVVDCRGQPFSLGLRRSGWKSALQSAIPNLPVDHSSRRLRTTGSKSGRGDGGSGGRSLSDRKEFDGYDPEHWPEMIGWLTKHVKCLEKAFGGRLKPLGQKLKAEFNSAGAFQEEVEG